MDNLSLAEIVANIGNWTLDKVNYLTSTIISNIILGNRTEIETSITNNFTQLNISNTTNWNAIVELQTSNGTTNTRIDNIVEDNATFNESKANTLYLNRTSEGLYTSTYNSTYAAWNDSGYIKDWSLTYQEAWNSTYNATYEANNVSMKGYVDGQIDGLVNLTEAEVIIIVDGSGNWSADKDSYYTSTETDTLFTALPNLTFSDITTSIGNWSADRPNYINTTYVGSIGNWTLDKTSYYTKAEVYPVGSLYNQTYINALGNFSGWDKDYNDLINTPTFATEAYVDSIGNWTADKSSYATTAYVAAIGNFTAWGYNYDDMVNTPTALSNFSDDVGYFSDIVNFTGTLTNAKACIYDSGNTEIDCDTTLTTGTVTSVATDDTYLTGGANNIYWNYNI